jgi:hypothetical protein
VGSRGVQEKPEGGIMVEMDEKLLDLKKQKRTMLGILMLNLGLQPMY